jgi:hypothetical protein
MPSLSSGIYLEVNPSDFNPPPPRYVVGELPEEEKAQLKEAAKATSSSSASGGRCVTSHHSLGSMYVSLCRWFIHESND